jgi:hypothetical protein
MPTRAQRAILLSSWFLITCLSVHAELGSGLAKRLQAYATEGVLRGALKRVAEVGVAAPMPQEPSSKVGCSAADATEEPCPMRILFHRDGRAHWLTGIGTITSHGLSAMTDLGLEYGNTTTELSHDGEVVAYVDCRASYWGIYVFSLETSEVRKVIPIDPGDSCHDARWSQDDRMLSYVSSSGYGLNVVSVDGSTHFRLPTIGGLFWESWSPSGEEIVYENGRGGSRSLRIINLRGSIRDLVRYGDIKDCEAWAPDWSPDGTRIAFTACGRLYTISPQGTDLQQLAPGAEAYSPRWSVDGQWIFFLFKDDLMRVRRDGKFLCRVAVIPPPYDGASQFSLGMAR